MRANPGRAARHRRRARARVVKDFQREIYLQRRNCRRVAQQLAMTPDQLQSSEHWRKFDLDDAPDQAGIYAIKDAKCFLYIGRSVSIKTRVNNTYHPCRITAGLQGIQLHYVWTKCPKGVSLGRYENLLIAKHSPEWNGCTEVMGHPSPWPKCSFQPQRQWTKEEVRFFLEDFFL